MTFLCFSMNGASDLPIEKIPRVKFQHCFPDRRQHSRSGSLGRKKKNTAKREVRKRVSRVTFDCAIVCRLKIASEEQLSTFCLGRSTDGSRATQHQASILRSVVSVDPVGRQQLHLATGSPMAVGL
ncbi:hypothetical protein ROHU_018408 [Labeo rohita]|uniref:Uncharacterized protein n=1 Tax=Labeo rohita TaxID=84645 RepID=A0A498NBX2_LABRO|nr:hypothetical protein ROHU_018408 [Labeo rohita]